MTDPRSHSPFAQALGPLEITLPPDLAFVIHMRAIQAGMTPEELVIDVLRDVFQVIETEAKVA